MRLEKNATLVSTSVASLLVVMKMSIGILSGSIAVLASAIDSLLDLIVSLFNYFALHNAEKDPDDNFNYGRSKIEPLAAVVEGVVISLSALFILYEALLKIAHPREMDYMSESIVVMLLSIIITSLLVLFLNSVAKKITDIIESKKETTNYHNLQTRESGSHIFISVHVVFNVSISLYDAHLISDKLEIQLKGLFKNKKVHVLIHMDPYDDSEINEMEETY